MPYYHRGQLTAYRKGRYKLQFYEDGGFRKKRERPALFDLHQDLGERLDIADQHPDIVETIMAAVLAHQAGVARVAPIFDLRLDGKGGHRPIDSGLIGLICSVGWKVILRARGG